MNRTLCGFILIVAASAPAFGQLKLEINWDKIAPKAVEKVDLTLDASMLQMAAKFLSGEKQDEAKIKRLIRGLKSIQVKSFEFEKEGQYSLRELDPIRSQLRAPEWSKILDVQNKREGETAGIYIKSDGKQMQGIVIIAAEPKELTVVNIAGSISLDDLAALGGNFGIPKMELNMRDGRDTRPPEPEKKKD
jgi:hypothetical protein